MGKAGRARAETDFDLNRTVLKYERMYTELARESGCIAAPLPVEPASSGRIVPGRRLRRQPMRFSLQTYSDSRIGRQTAIRSTSTPNSRDAPTSVSRSRTACCRCSEHSRLSTSHGQRAQLGLDIEFKGAIRADVDYDVDSVADDAGLRIIVRSSDAAVLSIRLERSTDPSFSPIDRVEPQSGLRTTPGQARGRRARREARGRRYVLDMRSSQCVPRSSTERRIREPGRKRPPACSCTCPRLVQLSRRDGSARPEVAVHARVAAVCRFFRRLRDPGLSRLHDAFRSGIPHARNASGGGDTRRTNRGRGHASQLRALWSTGVRSG